MFFQTFIKNNLILRGPTAINDTRGYFHNSTNIVITDTTYFNDYANGDYHLTVNASNAISEGDPSINVFYDLDGIARDTSIMDVGAYKYI